MAGQKTILAKGHDDITRLVDGKWITIHTHVEVSAHEKHACCVNVDATFTVKERYGAGKVARLGHVQGVTIDRSTVDTAKGDWRSELLTLPRRSVGNLDIYAENRSIVSDLKRLLLKLFRANGDIHPAAVDFRDALAGDRNLHYIPEFRLENEFVGKGLGRPALCAYIRALRKLSNGYSFSGTMLLSPAGLRSAWEQINQSRRAQGQLDYSFLEVEAKLIKGYELNGFELCVKGDDSQQGAAITVMIRRPPPLLPPQRVLSAARSLDDGFSARGVVRESDDETTRATNNRYTETSGLFPLHSMKQTIKDDQMQYYQQTQKGVLIRSDEMELDDDIGDSDVAIQHASGGDSRHRGAVAGVVSGQGARESDDAGKQQGLQNGLGDGALTGFDESEEVDNQPPHITNQNEEVPKPPLTQPMRETAEASQVISAAKPRRQRKARPGGSSRRSNIAGGDYIDSDAGDTTVAAANAKEENLVSEGVDRSAVRDTDPANGVADDMEIDGGDSAPITAVVQTPAVQTMVQQVTQTSHGATRPSRLKREIQESALFLGAQAEREQRSVRRQQPQLYRWKPNGRTYEVDGSENPAWFQTGKAVLIPPKM